MSRNVRGRSKKSRRASTPKNKPLVIQEPPYPISVLAVDLGKSSGYAEYNAKGELVDWGEIQLDKDFLGVYHCLQDFLNETDYRCLVLENTMWGRQVMGPVTGVWKYAALSLGYKPREIKGLHVRTWRKAIYGGAKLTTEEAKELAIETVHHMYELDEEVTHNTAEAILMGSAAQRMGFVKHALTKRQLKKCLI